MEPLVISDCSGGPSSSSPLSRPLNQLNTAINPRCSLLGSLSSCPRSPPTHTCLPSAWHTMTISDIVSDESLQPVLSTSADTLAQCHQLLALLNPDSIPTDSASVYELSLAASKQQKILYALLAQLRGQNRDACFRVRDTKQATAEARQEIDRLHLQLQNLYYEQKHLTGEIAACEAYE